MSIVQRIEVNTRGKGLYEFTDRVQECLRHAGIDHGLCTLFIQHTSASLIIQENADPSVQHDLVSWLDRHVPEHDPHYTHTSEGPDDMPAHIKAAITQTSISIPVIDRRLALGTWQGVYLWEHRRAPYHRMVIAHFTS